MTSNYKAAKISERYTGLALLTGPYAIFMGTPRGVANLFD